MLDYLMWSIYAAHGLCRSDERMLCSLRARLLLRLQMTSSQRQWSTKSAGAHWQTQVFLS